MNYKFTLAESRTKVHQVTALHLLAALAFLGAGAIIYVYNFQITYYGLALIVLALGLMGITIGRNKWINKLEVNVYFRILELVLAVVLAIYSFQQGWKPPMGIFGVLTLALGFALVWERPSFNAIEIMITDDAIKLPSNQGRRYIEWEEVEQIIFKYGILSVNCKDNRLFQWNVKDAPMDPKAFERDCNSKITPVQN
jgi:hypothetical protein